MEMTFENDGKIENEKRTEMQKERMQNYQEKINALKVKTKEGKTNMDSEFTEYVKNNIREYLPESYANAKIQIQQTIKGNDRVLDSLTVQREGEDFAVAIHLNSLEQEYQNGESMHEIMNQVADQCLQGEELPFNRREFLDYDSVKDHVTIKMCDPENNVKYLEQYAHKNCGTLTALYNVTLEQNGFGTASMPISNDHLKMWGISVEQLHQDALLADRNRGYGLYGLEDLVYSMAFEHEPENLLLSTDVVNASEKGPYVLTNTSRINGANALVQEEVLSQVGDALGGDYYVLPSSTHELILIQDDGSISKEALERMVTEINSTQVSKEDLLSNKVQFYDSHQKQLRLDKNEVAKEKIAEQVKGVAERKVRRNIKEPKKIPHKL